MTKLNLPKVVGFFILTDAMTKEMVKDYKRIRFFIKYRKSLLINNQNTLLLSLYGTKQI